MSNTPRNVIFPERFKPKPRPVQDCQGETPSANLLERLKRSKAGLDSGMSVADVRRNERARSLGIIRREAEAVALFETPKVIAADLRALADEFEGKDIA